MKTQNLTLEEKKEGLLHYEVPLSTSIAIKAGIVVTLSLIAYFLTMRMFELHQVLLFRFFNFFFLLSGIIWALNAYKVKTGQKIDYFVGLYIGCYTTIISVIPFALFVLMYLNADTVFMQLIVESVPYGKFLTAGTASGAILIEGTSSGLIISFIAMQYYKDK